MDTIIESVLGVVAVVSAVVVATGVTTWHNRRLSMSATRHLRPGSPAGRRSAWPTLLAVCSVALAASVAAQLLLWL